MAIQCGNTEQQRTGCLNQRKVAEIANLSLIWLGSQTARSLDVALAACLDGFARFGMGASPTPMAFP
eukprot:266934-Chlamydomonas_euryale.AAC.2